MIWRAPEPKDQRHGVVLPSMKVQSSFGRRAELGASWILRECFRERSRSDPTLPRPDPSHYHCVLCHYESF